MLVVCHALTGNSRLDQWWGDLLGEIIKRCKIYCRNNDGFILLNISHKTMWNQFNQKDTETKLKFVFLQDLVVRLTPRNTWSSVPTCWGRVMAAAVPKASILQLKKNMATLSLRYHCYNHS